MLLPWCLSVLPQITVLLFSATIFPQNTGPFFFQSRVATRESDFPLDWTQPVPSFKSYSLNLKEKHSQRKAAKSTLISHRGNNSFVHRDSYLFQSHKITHSLAIIRRGGNSDNHKPNAAKSLAEAQQFA